MKTYIIAVILVTLAGIATADDDDEGPVICFPSGSIIICT